MTKEKFKEMFEEIWGLKLTDEMMEEIERDYGFDRFRRSYKLSKEFCKKHGKPRK